MNVETAILILRKYQEKNPLQMKAQSGNWVDVNYSGILDETWFVQLLGEDRIRVKPEPRYWWAFVDPSSPYFGRLFQTREEAINSPCSGTGTFVVQVKEVL